MRELQDALYKIENKNPNDFKARTADDVRIPITADDVTSLDQQLIQTLVAYKEEIKRRAEEAKAQEFHEKESEPSQEALDLKSFIYDHLDEFEEVLSDDDYDELESLIMNI